MAIKTRNTLKTLFADGKILTDAILADLIDSYLHLSDDGSTKIKSLLAADKLNASHVDTSAIWAAFTNAMGAGCHFVDSQNNIVGFTSAEEIQIPAGSQLEFECYLSSLVPASKIMWIIFDESGWYVFKPGSNFYQIFNQAGTYTIAVAAKDANNATIAQLTMENWVIVTGSPTTPLLTKAQIEIPSPTLDNTIVDCEIVGNAITCELPLGTDPTKLIPRILYNGTMESSDDADFKNGAVVDLSGYSETPMNITITNTTDANYTLLVTVATS